MAAQLQFRDVTLGYDRHPAVHHLSGEVAPGALIAVVGLATSQLTPAFWAGVLLLAFTVIAGVTVAMMSAPDRGAAPTALAFGFVAVADFRLARGNLAGVGLAGGDGAFDDRQLVAQPG